MKLNKAFALRVRELLKEKKDDTIQTCTRNRLIPQHDDGYS